MRALAASVALAALLLAAPAQASFEPQGLHVVGGEETWRPDRSFELRWANPEGVAAVHYRVLAASGDPAVAEATLDWPATAIEHLNVPATPGIYTAEVWLEGSAGQLGPPASAELRFDDTRPGRTDPAVPKAWIGRGAFPLTVRLSRPEGPQPPSGIRGYALSIEGNPEGEPCAGPGLCDSAETDLSGGIGDSTTSIPGLPEGTSYLHAAAVSGAGVRSPTVTVALHVDRTDPATTLSGVGAGWSRQPVSLLAHATDGGSGMAAEGSGGPFTAIRVDGNVPITAPGDRATATVIPSGIHTVAYYARDAAGNVADGALVSDGRNAEPGTATVRIDRDPPAVAFVSAQDPRDPERIEATVHDPLSGFDPSRGEIGVRPAGSRQRFHVLATKAANSRLVAYWDSVSLPPGAYEFRVTAYDAAGNSASSLLRSSGAPMVLHAPLKAQTTLVAHLIPSGALYAPMGTKKRTGREWTVDYGARVLFGGRLIAGRHSPLARAQVRVIERFGADSGLPERVSTVPTGGDGRFAIRLQPGPSREVLATAAPTPTLAGASSKPARLLVRGRLRLRASAPIAKVGGRPVVFSGRVAGGSLPPGGKAVELQFRLPGLRWSEFRTVTTDARGRFHYAYRFVDDDSRGARFQFRAYAPAQAGWPYEAAGSRPVTVRGR